MEKMTNIHGSLLEGCVWDEREEKLYFVDIEGRKIYCLDPETGFLSGLEMKDYVSCIVLRPDGNLMAALPDGLYRVNFHERTAKKVMESCLPEEIRYNDGKCGPDGILWIGSMAICQNEDAQHVGALFCIEKEKIRAIYSGFTIPNGLAWNEEGTCFYHIDTPTRKVDRYRMKGKYQLFDKETAVDLSREEGSPDGMCIDSRGNLWIAMWGGGCVLCADPLTGQTFQRLQVPDKYVSCCTFGGAQMDQLFITTARSEDGSGGELYVEKMQVKGVKAERYGETE